MEMTPVGSCVFVSTPDVVKLYSFCDEHDKPVDYCGATRLAAFKHAFDRPPESRKELMELTSPVCPFEMQGYGAAAEKELSELPDA